MFSIVYDFLKAYFLVSLMIFSGGNSILSFIVRNFISKIKFEKNPRN